MYNRIVVLFIQWFTPLFVRVFALLRPSQHFIIVLHWKISQYWVQSLQLVNVHFLLFCIRDTNGECMKTIGSEAFYECSSLKKYSQIQSHQLDWVLCISILFRIKDSCYWKRHENDWRIVFYSCHLFTRMHLFLEKHANRFIRWWWSSWCKTTVYYARGAPSSGRNTTIIIAACATTATFVVVALLVFVFINFKQEADNIERNDLETTSSISGRLPAIHI